MSRILELAAEGRIIRNDWSGTDDLGRELLCLYTAMVGRSDARPETCPASLCPRWLAHLLPWMDDSGSDAAWPAMVQRVGALAPRFGRLRGVVSTHLRSRVLAIIVRDAVQNAGAEHEAVTRVLELLDRHGAGKRVTRAQWEVARDAAWAAADNAAWVATHKEAGAALAAGDAAEASVMVNTVAAIVDAIAAMVDAAVPKVSEAVDRVTAAILDEIERTLDAMEVHP